MGTVAEKLNKVLKTKADIKAAIIEKGQNAGDVFSTYADKIRAIETGKDVSGVTATAADVLSPKVFVDSSGNKVTGTIASKTASNLSANGATVTVPAGHYATQATKSVATATQATPSISVDSAGKITASATQSAGYVASGTKSATKQLATQAAKTITPGTSDQTAIAAETYATGAVTVTGDANLVPENIPLGKSIFGVEGNLDALKLQETLVTATLPAFGMWNSVTYGNGRFVAVASNSKQAAYSDNGVTWNAATLPASEEWYSVTYGNGRFVAVAFISDQAAYSDDGVTWRKTATLPAFGMWSSVTYGNGRFVAVENGVNTAAYSDDGVTWRKTATLPVSEEWYSVTYGNGRFVAVARITGQAAYSDDGATWSNTDSETKIVDTTGTDVTEETVQATGLLDRELSVQDDLIAQIMAALANKGYTT